MGAGEFGQRTKPVAEKTDGAGKTWGLLASGVLGSRGDLYLAQQVDGAWRNPLFTGVSLDGVSRWAKPAPPEPRVKGFTAKELVKADWLAALAGDADLTKDTDGDGLTDIEEARLGTDPTKADTDADGDHDQVDPWPNAAGQPNSDAERILAAAFEARYHVDQSAGPALLFAPEGASHFEMPGRRGPTMWTADSERWTLPLERCYEQGVAFIRFTEQDRSASKPWPDRAIKWSKNGAEAYVSISTYYGGLNGTTYGAVLREFGENWVVVSMRMESIS